MRRLVAVITTLIVFAGAPTSFGAEDSTGAAKALVDSWVDVQNRGDFAGYSVLYASGFTGIRRSAARTVKLDRSGWLRERERMFQKKPTVDATDVRIAPAADGSSITVELEQRWESASYSDVGKKTLTLVTEDGKLRISHEEMINSKRLVRPGERIEIYAPMRSLGAAQEFESGITSVLGELSDYPIFAGPFASFSTRAEESPPRISFAVCEGEAAARVERFFRELVPETDVRPTKREPNCPLVKEPEIDYPAGEWDWQKPVSISVGKNTLLVFVFQYEEDQPGDFARALRGNLVLAVLRDPRGRIIDHAVERSESDYSPLTSVEVKDGKVVVTEKDIDRPCDGADRHPYREYLRTYRVSVGGKDPKVRVKTSRKLVSVDRCSDDEAQIYRDAERRQAQ
jgi:hypothetical protein